MNSLIKVTRYLLMLFILISCLAALVVLGLDLDLLLNGPDYLSKVISNIVNRFTFILLCNSFVIITLDCTKKKLLAKNS